MPFSSMHSVTVGLTSASIESYTDELALALNAQQIRSSKDEAYLSQVGLFGTQHIKKFNKDLEDVELAVSNNLVVTDKLTTKVDSNTLIKIESFLADTQETAYRALILYNFSCSGTMVSPNLASIIKIYNKNQMFWRLYRNIQQHKSTLSHSFMTANRSFYHTKGSFGANSGITPVGSFSLKDTTCLFTENSQINFTTKYVPVLNGLDTVHNVSFNYTCSATIG